MEIVHRKQTKVFRFKILNFLLARAIGLARDNGDDNGKKAQETVRTMAITLRSGQQHSDGKSTSNEECQYKLTM